MTADDPSEVVEVFTDELSYVRALVNTARMADEHDKQSIRLAKERINAIKAANPRFAQTKAR